ncbi:helix-turn-helix transcriptional regulator [Phragmitibacter flavus]|nr:helix-turn-helix transcriptional regulator [Phragmitibacter flavus]
MYQTAFSQGALHAIAHALPELVGAEVGIVSMIDKTGLSLQMSQEEVRKSMLRFPIDLLPTHPRQSRDDLQGNVVMISDLLSRKEWHRRELYQVSLDVHALEEDMGTDFRLRDGSMVNTCVLRKRRTFRESDRDLFTLLLPHMKALLEWDCPKCKEANLNGLGLTRKEQEVLLWVSEGKTNAEVGQILEISSGTVKIHLERIYKKLGVENRHGATRMALEKLHPRRFC